MPAPSWIEVKIRMTQPPKLKTYVTMLSCPVLLACACYMSMLSHLTKMMLQCHSYRSSIGTCDWALEWLLGCVSW